ncbi:MAG: antibiotic biosynthesis monooxygenase [Dehalococcoidia bacterium]
MFVAMNRFQVDPGRSEDFERGWRERESRLQEMAGFRSFALLKGDTPGDYISHSTWDSRDAFQAWTRSEQFRHAHSRGPAEGVLVGHPQAAFYEAVLFEANAGI